MRSFKKLTALTEQSVRTIGLETTIELFEMLLEHRAKLDEVPKLRTAREIQTLADFLLIRFSSYLKLDPAEFFLKKTSCYSDARCIFFHLLYTYSASSYLEIAEVTGVSKRTVSYQVQQCNNRVEFPNRNSRFVHDYNEMQRSVVAFIRSSLF